MFLWLSTFLLSAAIVLSLGTGPLGCSGPSSDSEETSTPTSSPVSTPTSSPGTLAVWTPPPGTTFQWVLDEPIDTTAAAEAYDVDLFYATKEVVDQLHAKGRKVICYVSVGTYENWRPDKDSFPASIIGKDYVGWPGEKWLDIRKIDLIAPIMQKRFQMCKDKGFDALEPDNIDAYTNDNGFGLTSADQLNFNKWVASEVHKLGLSIGLKNDPDQATDLEPSFDWALTEDCFLEGWCPQFEVFTKKGKAVFQTEYTDTGIDFNAACTYAKSKNFTAVLKHRDLDAYRKTCP